MAFKKLKYWFDIDLAKMLAVKITEVYPDFQGSDFCKMLETKLDDLELKDRVEVFADALDHFLKDDYPSNVSILTSILGLENEEETGMFSNFYWVMPIAKYVEKYGLEDFKESMNIIEEITKRNTSEYAIRPFLEKYPKRTLEQMIVWSNDKNRHIRRLASEGVRPRLPWATKLQQYIEHPEQILPILENLKDDTSKYVQKSVANCLNDILKDNADLGKEIIEKWTKNPTKQRKWILKHAIRNLRKKEDAWALEIVDRLER